MYSRKPQIFLPDWLRCEYLNSQGPWGQWFMRKNLKSKISCQTPFNRMHALTPQLGSTVTFLSAAWDATVFSDVIQFSKSLLTGILCIFFPYSLVLFVICTNVSYTVSMQCCSRSFSSMEIFWYLEQWACTERPGALLFLCPDLSRPSIFNGKNKYKKNCNFVAGNFFLIHECGWDPAESGIRCSRVVDEM
jgi:hypothetical protein